SLFLCHHTDVRSARGHSTARSGLRRARMRILSGARQRRGYRSLSASTGGAGRGRGIAAQADVKLRAMLDWSTYCTPRPPDQAPWCCPDTPVKNWSGPDEPETLCWIPDGCCGPSPCDIGPDDFMCQVRSLLPEGDPYNNTAESIREPPPRYGAITVGCARVGCEQLIFGSCCTEIIPCEVDPVA